MKRLDTLQQGGCLFKLAQEIAPPDFRWRAEPNSSFFIAEGELLIQNLNLQSTAQFSFVQTSG
jgi:hypothetical protein